MCQDPTHIFSLIPNPDQNKEDTSFISVVAYGAYNPLSRSIQFCLLPNQNFEKNDQVLADPAEPWILDLSRFLPMNPFSLGSNHLSKKYPVIKHIIA